MVPHRTLSARLSESAARSFYGREQEVALLRQALAAPDPPFAVGFVHGPGGIGKSRLIQAVLVGLPPHVRFLALDCRNIEPTPEGFLGALAGALGAPGVPDLAAIVASLTGDATRVVLVLDTYETFGLLDAWLRQIFIPALPDNVVTIIAGREAPNPAWLTTPGWQDLFRDFELREMAAADAERFLAARGLTPEQVARVRRFAGGYPLALELAATALRTQPDLNVAAGPPPRVLSQLTSAFLAGLPPDMTQAVEAAATVRRVTEVVLRAILDVTDARELLDRLQALPFAETTAEGVVLHDLVRDTIDADLARRDPERHRQYRARAWKTFARAARSAAGRTLWQCTADMLYLIQNPAVREGFFPRGATGYRVEVATEADAEAIRTIAATDIAASAEWLCRWWAAHPEAFSVARAPSQAVGAFYCMFDPTAVTPDLLGADPLTSAWTRHLEAHPIARGERVLFLRRWLAAGTGEAPSPGQAACWLDIKRTYMAWRPSLRRLYTAVTGLDVYAPAVIPLGFRPLAEADVALGGATYHTALLDFGPDSVDGWLAGLVEGELGLTFAAGAVAAARRPWTILFTDIVDSTAKVAAVGDRRWGELLEAHHALIRRELARWHGREVDTAGDGVFAVFETPADGIGCAQALTRAVASLGLTIRAGVHAGECEAVEDKVAGIAVHVGARVAAAAAPGEVLVSSTVRDLVAGSGLRFEDRGAHALKGIPGEWRLFAALREAP